MTGKKPYTLDDLANDILKLSPEQRQHKALIIIDDESYGTPILELNVLEEDIYVDKDTNDDGGTLAELKELHGEAFEISDYILSTHKGTPFLYGSNYPSENIETD